MKLTLEQCVTIWNVLNQLLDLNNDVSAKLKGAYVYLQPEIQTYYKLSVKERKAFKDAEINIPIVMITEEDLPPIMPYKLYEALNPIAEVPFENKKSQLEQLIEKRSNMKKVK